MVKQTLLEQSQQRIKLHNGTLTPNEDNTFTITFPNPFYAQSFFNEFPLLNPKNQLTFHLNDYSMVKLYQILVPSVKQAITTFTALYNKIIDDDDNKYPEHIKKSIEKYKPYFVSKKIHELDINEFQKFQSKILATVKIIDIHPQKIAKITQRIESLKNSTYYDSLCSMRDSCNHFIKICDNDALENYKNTLEKIENILSIFEASNKSKFLDAIKDINLLFESKKSELIDFIESCYNIPDNLFDFNKKEYLQNEKLISDIFQAYYKFDEIAKIQAKSINEYQFNKVRYKQIEEFIEKARKLLLNLKINKKCNLKPVSDIYEEIKITLKHIKFVKSIRNRILSDHGKCQLSDLGNGYYELKFFEPFNANSFSEDFRKLPADNLTFRFNYKELIFLKNYWDVKETIQTVSDSLNKLKSKLPAYILLDLELNLQKIRINAYAVSKDYSKSAISSLDSMKKLIDNLNKNFKKLSHSRRKNMILADFSQTFENFDKAMLEVDQGHQFFRRCLLTTCTLLGVVVGTIAGVSIGLTIGIITLPITLGANTFLCGFPGAVLFGYGSYKFGKWLNSFSSRENFQQSNLDFVEVISDFIKQIQNPDSILNFEKYLKELDSRITIDLENDKFVIRMPNMEIASKIKEYIRSIGISSNLERIYGGSSNNQNYKIQLSKESFLKFRNGDRELGKSLIKYQEILNEMLHGIKSLYATKFCHLEINIEKQFDKLYLSYNKDGDISGFEIFLKINKINYTKIIEENVIPKKEILRQYKIKIDFSELKRLCQLKQSLLLEETAIHDFFNDPQMMILHKNNIVDITFSLKERCLVNSEPYRRLANDFHIRPKIIKNGYNQVKTIQITSDEFASLVKNLTVQPREDNVAIEKIEESNYSFIQQIFSFN